MSFRTFGLSALLVIGGTVFAHANELTAYIDIPAQPLGNALRQFADQTGLQLAVETSMTVGKSAPALKGDFSSHDALGKLLEGSGLKYKFLDSHTVAVSALVQDIDSQKISSAIRSKVNLAQTSDPSQTTNTSPPAGSEEAMGDKKVEEIIVTAQKREQRLIDVPMSISAMGGEELERRGISNVQDLSFAVSGLAVNEVGPGRQNISIRGVANVQGVTSLTGVYLDEIPVSGAQDGAYPAFIDIRTVDLQRVEVLKGPQGTLFGEGAVGGVVRFITKDPDLTRFGGRGLLSFYDSADSGWSTEATGIVNAPIVEDKLALRIVGTYENKSGWIDKLGAINGPVIDENFNDNEVTDIRAKALWAPMEGLNIKAMFIDHKGAGGGNNVVNLEPRSDSNFIIEFDPTSRTSFIDEYQISNLAVEYGIGFAELLSSTSYVNKDSTAGIAQRRPIRVTPTSPPGSPFQEIQAPNYELNNTIFTQELRLTSAGEGPLTWTLGGVYKDEELTKFQINGISAARFGSVFLRNVPSGNVATASESWAIFGDASYEITPRLEVGGGVRYFEDSREAYDPRPGMLAASFRSGEFSATTYRGYLSYEIFDGVRTYGNIGTGFRSGSFNGLAAVAQGAPLGIDPETITSYELGTKMEFGRVNASVALFHSRYESMQVISSTLFNDSGPAQVPFAFVANIGEAKIDGVEWELNWQATDQLSFGISGDVINTEILELDPRVVNPPTFVGDRIDFVPDYHLNFTADYAFHWASSLPGYVSAQYSQQGESTFTARNIDRPEPVTSTDMLRFLNGSVGLEWEGWEFQLFGRNLLDERGSLRPGDGLTAQARPRTYGFKIDKSF